MKDLNDIQQYLQNLKNAGDQPLLDSSPEISKVKLVHDKTVTPGNFKQSQIDPQTYYAHPLTIRAVKKDIFMAGDGFEDLEEIITCEGCKRKLDKQFWHFCPHCEKGFN